MSIQEPLREALAGLSRPPGHDGSPGVSLGWEDYSQSEGSCLSESKFSGLSAITKGQKKTKPIEDKPKAGRPRPLQREQSPNAYTYESRCDQLAFAKKPFSISDLAPGTIPIHR